MTDEPKINCRTLTLADRLERLDRSIAAAKKKLETHLATRAELIAAHEAKIKVMRNEVPRP